jgi:hypothetical protein
MLGSLDPAPAGPALGDPARLQTTAQADPRDWRLHLERLRALDEACGGAGLGQRRYR